MENLPIQNESTKQLPVEKQDEKPKNQPLSEFQNQIEALIPTAGTIQLTNKQKEILYAPVKDEDVCIRPDGLVYLPWMEYVGRLRDAFGMSWAIIPKGNPVKQGDLILWGFWLVVDGHLAGFSVGEQLYQPTNATMTYGDVLEGAKSNALMRLCKGVGISLELWKPSFVKAWKDKFAEEYFDEKKNKKLWRKKGQVISEPNGESIKEDVPKPEEKTPEVNEKKSEILTAEFIGMFSTATKVDELKEIWKKVNLSKQVILPEHFLLIEGIKERLKGKLK